MVVGIIFLVIVPLPTPILDFMFITNLTLSFVILLTTMYIREALEFSIFPSLLLLTTLFRLALNISSTRQILLNGGYAGEVIKTFGEFVIQGNVVVGLIIFLIIVLVQFWSSPRAPSAWPRSAPGSPSTPCPASRWPSTPTSQAA